MEALPCPLQKEHLHKPKHIVIYTPGKFRLSYGIGIDYRNTWPSTKGSDLFNKLWDMLWLSLGEEGASEDSEVHNKIKEEKSPGQVQSRRHSISWMYVTKTMSWQ
jgi:hypothetical protein